MRPVIASAIAATLVLGLSLPADAKSKRKKKPVRYGYVERVVPWQDDSYDCIRARGLDPAGNYRGMPCWARAALSGRQNR